jgi:hypothetical protein
MSTDLWRARRLPIPAAWPVRSSPAVRQCAIISAGLAPILLTGAYLIAGILQPDAQDDQHDGRPGRNRPVDHDRRHLSRQLLLSRHRCGPGGRPGPRSRPADSGGPGRHRHRRVPRTRQQRDPAAPSLDRARRGHDSRVARPRRPTCLAAAADPERLRLRHRNRHLRRPARLAVHRDPRLQRPGPGRSADVIDPDLPGRSSWPSPCAAPSRRARSSPSYPADRPSAQTVPANLGRDGTPPRDQPERRTPARSPNPARRGRNGGSGRGAGRVQQKSGCPIRPRHFEAMAMFRATGALFAGRGSRLPLSPGAGERQEASP